MCNARIKTLWSLFQKSRRTTSWYACSFINYRKEITRTAIQIRELNSLLKLVCAVHTTQPQAEIPKRWNWKLVSCSMALMHICRNWHTYNGAHLSSCRDVSLLELFYIMLIAVKACPLLLRTWTSLVPNAQVSATRINGDGLACPSEPNAKAAEKLAIVLMFQEFGSHWGIFEGRGKATWMASNNNHCQIFSKVAFRVRAKWGSEKLCEGMAGHRTRRPWSSEPGSATQRTGLLWAQGPSLGLWLIPQVCGKAKIRKRWGKL